MKHRRNLRVGVRRWQGGEDEARQHVVARRGG